MTTCFSRCAPAPAAPARRRNRRQKATKLPSEKVPNLKLLTYFSTVFVPQGAAAKMICPNSSKKSAPKVQNEPQEPPRSAHPRRPQESPGALQERPRSAPREPRSPPRGPGDPKTAPRAILERIWNLRDLIWKPLGCPWGLFSSCFMSFHASSLAFLASLRKWLPPVPAPSTVHGLYCFLNVFLPGRTPSVETVQPPSCLGLGTVSPHQDLFVTELWWG